MPGPADDRPAPRHSILLASRNEGDRLRRTVESLLAHAPRDPFEVIVVDDASDDGSAEGLTRILPPGAPVRIARNETRRGLIHSRARAADLARGRTLAFLDAHCAVADGWLDSLAQALERIEGRGIALPAIHCLREEDWTIDRGCPPASACTIGSPFLDFVWAPPLPIDGYPSSCTMPGGAWMCGRSWYDHIGGLDRDMVSWGGENIDVPLRTWAAGGRCLVAEDVAIGHLYGRKRRDPVDPADLVFNKIRAVHNALSKETFRRILPALSYLGGFDDAFRRALADRSALAERKARFEAIRMRPDSWIIEAFRLPLLEPPLFHLAYRPAPAADSPRPRPAVLIAIQARDRAQDADPCIRSLRESTTYGNYEIAKRVETDRPAAAAIAANRAAASSGAEILVLLPAGARILDPNWIERFILLFERHPRLFLAFPRTRWRPTDGAAEPATEGFDIVWDPDAPRRFRLRCDVPLSDRPYQALSCPDTMLVLRRVRFLALGGFDGRLARTGLPILDLAIRGWLAGYEVYCHPGVLLERDPPVDLGETNDRFAPGSAPRRLGLRRRRRRLLARSPFDEGWLLQKFGIEAWKR